MSSEGGNVDCPNTLQVLQIYVVKGPRPWRDMAPALQPPAMETISNRYGHAVRQDKTNRCGLDTIGAQKAASRVQLREHA